MTRISILFKEFLSSKKAEGFILIGVTILSLLLANSAMGENFIHFVHKKVDLSFAGLHLNYSVEHWVNDGLMTLFFLLVGLEIERELYVGELSSFKNALFPVIGAIGGMLIPALIHFVLNAGTEFQAGFGIPMATDIAFALGILALAGNRVPVSLKIFLTALAIIDDLGAILVIALFYTKSLSLFYLAGALLTFVVLFICGKLKFYFLPLYLVGGLVMWYCMLQSGIHATLAGVMLAFAIPFPRIANHKNPSFRLQHMLHLPVAFIVLPIFAFINTAIIIPSNLPGLLNSSNVFGIALGLVIGKPLGIVGICYLSQKLKIAFMPAGINWRQLAGAGVLAGIGFTMSIFITNLAFSDGETIAGSKIAILLSSVVAAIAGLVIVKGKTRENLKI